jgi:hypothetical protein
VCEHRSKRIKEKVKVSEEEIPCAYAATQTRIVYRVTYQCNDCGDTWTDEKEEWREL